MTVSLNTVSSSTAYQPYVPTVGQSTSTAALSSQAVSLSAQSAVVASLGGSTGATVYTPSGLLNTLQQAGVATESSADSGTTDGGTDTGTTAQQSLDQSLVSSLSGSASSSGVYSGSGTVDSVTAQASANWAELLKTNPGLASTVISSSYNLGIVSSLQVTA